MNLPKLTYKDFWYGVLSLYIFSVICFFLKGSAQVGFSEMNTGQILAVSFLPLIHMFLPMVVILIYLAFKGFKIEKSFLVIVSIAIAYVIHILFYSIAGPDF